MSQLENPLDVSQIDLEFHKELRNLCKFSTSDEAIRVREFMDYYQREGYGQMSDRTFYRILEGERPAPVSIIVALMKYTKSSRLLALFATDERLAARLAAQVELLRDMADTIARKLREVNPGEENHE